MGDPRLIYIIFYTLKNAFTTDFLFCRGLSKRMGVTDGRISHTRRISWDPPIRGFERTCFDGSRYFSKVFSRTPKDMGPLKMVSSPCYSHTTPSPESLKIWEACMGNLPFSGVPCPWGSLKIPLNLGPLPIKMCINRL